MESSFSLGAPSPIKVQSFKEVNRERSERGIGERPATTVREVQYAGQRLVLEKSLSKMSKRENESSRSSPSAALKITADEIIEKLNELLAQKLPDGVESLRYEDFTPEKTSERILNSIASLYAPFRKANADLSDEEAVTKFMELASKGVEQGYGEAFDILEGLGAFSFEGVQAGIEKTKALLEEGLQNLESKLRETFLSPKESTTPQELPPAPLPEGSPPT